MSLTPKQCIISAASESLLAILELTIGLVSVRSVLDHFDVFELFGFGFELKEALTQCVMTLLVCYWMAFRAASAFRLPSAKVLWERIGGFDVRISSLGVSVIAMHAIGLFTVWFMANKMEKSILSFENYLLEPEFVNLNWRRITEMLIFAPLREELVFRGIMVNIFYRKVCLSGDPILTLLAQTFGPSVMFSLIHLFNFSAGKFSNSYVVVQVLVGFIVGSFYSMRYISSNTIWEPLLLHMGNNLFSSFLSSKYEFDAFDPLIVFPILQTCLVYLMLCLYGWRQLVQSLDESFEGLADAAEHKSQNEKLEHLRKLILESSSTSDSDSSRKSKKNKSSLEQEFADLSKEIDAFAKSRDLEIRQALLKYSSEFTFLQRIVPFRSPAMEFYTKTIEPLYKSQRFAYSRLEQLTQINPSS